MSDAPQKVKISCVYDELVPCKDLRPNPQNPNRHPKAQLERFVDVLLEQGVRKPIVVSRQSGMMVTGHGTLQTIMLAGGTMAPVDFQDFDSYAQEYAHMVADNALQQWSALDKAMINEAVGDLGPELELDHLGMQQFSVDVADHGDVPPSSTEDVSAAGNPRSASDAVRKIILFYADRDYERVMDQMMQLSERMSLDNLSDLIANLVNRAWKETEAK